MHSRQYVAWLEAAMDQAWNNMDAALKREDDDTHRVEKARWHCYKNALAAFRGEIPEAI